MQQELLKPQRARAKDVLRVGLKNPESLAVEPPLRMRDL